METMAAAILLGFFWLVQRVHQDFCLTMTSNSTAPFNVLVEEMAVKLECFPNDTDREVVGVIESLTITTVDHHFLQNFERAYPGAHFWNKHYSTHIEMKPLVTLKRSGQIIWGDGYANRAVASAGEGPGITSLSVTIPQLHCTDNSGYICVAQGPAGTLDSNTYYMGVIVFPRNVSITGGRRWSTSPRDTCDVYAISDERVDLSCATRIYPNEYAPFAFNITWHQDTEDVKMELDGHFTAKRNSDDCSMTTARSLTIYSNWTQDRENLTFTCNIEYLGYPDEVREVSGRITLCADASAVPRSPRSGFTQEYAIGVSFAGVAAVLALVVLALLSCMCCCGYRCRKVAKKTPSDIY